MRQNYFTSTLETEVFDLKTNQIKNVSTWETVPLGNQA